MLASLFHSRGIKEAIFIKIQNMMLSLQAIYLGIKKLVAVLWDLLPLQCLLAGGWLSWMTPGGHYLMQSVGYTQAVKIHTLKTSNYNEHKPLAINHKTHSFLVCHFINQFNILVFLLQGCFFFDWVWSLVSCCRMYQPPIFVRCKLFCFTWILSSSGEGPISSQARSGENILLLLAFSSLNPRFSPQNIGNDFHHGSHHYWSICIYFFWMPWQPSPSPLQCVYLNAFPLPQAMILQLNFSLTLLKWTFATF